MIHPHTEMRFISSEIGFGVIATRLIPRGSITWVQDQLDQVLTPQKVASLGPQYAEILDKYSYLNRDGDHVLCWDLARYINHSCVPTCLGPGYNFEIAVRDILPGEQLTDDYACLNLTNSFQCFCGAAGCRGLIREDDVISLASRWDDTVGEIFPEIASVSQPLWPLVQEKKEVQGALAGRNAIATCRVNLRAFDSQSRHSPAVPEFFLRANPVFD